MGRRFLYYKIVAAILPITIFLSTVSCKRYSTDYYITNQSGIGVYHSMDQKKRLFANLIKLSMIYPFFPVSFRYDGKITKVLAIQFDEISRNTVQDGAKITTSICLEYRKELQVDVILAIYP